MRSFNLLFRFLFPVSNHSLVSLSLSDYSRLTEIRVSFSGGFQTLSFGSRMALRGAGSVSSFFFLYLPTCPPYQSYSVPLPEEIDFPDFSLLEQYLPV